MTWHADQKQTGPWGWFSYCLLYLIFCGDNHYLEHGVWSVFCLLRRWVTRGVFVSSLGGTCLNSSSLINFPGCFRFLEPYANSAVTLGQSNAIQLNHRGQLNWVWKKGELAGAFQPLLHRHSRCRSPFLLYVLILSTPRILRWLVKQRGENKNPCVSNFR